MRATPWTDPEDIMLSEVSQTSKSKYKGLLKVVGITETENRSVVARACRRGRGGQCVVGAELQRGKTETFRERRGGGCAAV